MSRLMSHKRVKHCQVTNGVAAYPLLHDTLLPQPIRTAFMSSWGIAQLELVTWNNDPQPKPFVFQHSRWIKIPGEQELGKLSPQNAKIKNIFLSSSQGFCLLMAA
uniref:Uncharacterized protein n=1 Tax=Anguilla anguilla TaxID=7936 RepID=A0A0E9Q652_ANGAN